jgi:hypothetical protein
MTPRPYVSVEELKEQVTGDPDAAEDLVNSLIRSIGRNVRINAGKIHWDSRTNQGDGGKDLVVNEDHNDDEENFLPKRRSYWSIKSGDDGRRRAKFREEIRHHPKVQAWLAAGNKYVWCCLHPATEAERKEIEDDRSTMVTECRNTFTEDQIEFRWIEQVRDAVNLHPAVALHHVPIAMTRRGYLLTLDEWASKDTGNTQWVNFDERNELVEGLIQHFLSTSEPNVIHIAGMSGIGKSRLVREACTRMRTEHQIECLYCESYELIKPKVHELTRLFGSDGSAILILDEFPFDGELDVIESLFRASARNLRIVTVCPTVRQTTQTRDNRILLGEPSSTDAVFSVIVQKGTNLPEERLKVIASKSAQDLRFALRWVNEANRDPSAISEITGGAMPLLNHILARCGLNSQEQEHLRNLFDAASCFVDIGVAGDVKAEIDSVATLFALDDSWLGKAIGHAKNFGLSAQSKYYVEATPRGLAEMVFAKRGWATISRDLRAFFELLPDRLRKRFIERCQDCPYEIREEVMSLLGDYFRGVLSASGLGFLHSSSTAKIFAAWAQFDPDSGLDWLARTVESSSEKDLREFKGDAYRGEYAGRRHIVSLCDSLSRFPQHFHKCERILFRLALAESEPSIGNNATGIWKSLFWPTLSQSALPFRDRAQILLKRLWRESGKKRQLCIDAAFDVLQSRTVGLPIPPRVVGGILAPEPWRVTSTEQLKEYRQWFAEMFLTECIDCNEEERKHFQTMLSKNLLPFVFLDLTNMLRFVFGTPLNVQIAVAISEAIRRAARIVEKESYKENGAQWAEFLRRWEGDLRPRDLENRLAFVLRQSPWELENAKCAIDSYATIAEELARDTSVLDDLSVVLASDENKGAYNLGYTCGQIAAHLKFEPQVKTWLRNGMCESFVAGFVFARIIASDPNTKAWQDELDGIIHSQPLYCATITMMVDLSERGFQRLLTLVDSGGVSDVQVYSRLGVGGWLNVLSEKMQTDVCSRLEKVSESAKDLGASIAMDLIFMWTHINNDVVPSHLKEYCLKFMSLAANSSEFSDTYKWSELARKLVDDYPIRIAKLILDMYRPSATAIRFDTESLDPILVKAATLEPNEIMDLLGEILLDEGTRTFFEMARHEGVFESIGERIIEEWIAKDRRDYLGNIASHVASPFVGSLGQVELPKVLEWLFTVYEDDNEMFDGYLSGRHRLNVGVGKIDVTQVEHAMRPFLGHALRRVKEWAEWEIEQAKREQEWLDDFEDKRNRR